MVAVVGCSDSRGGATIGSAADTSDKTAETASDTTPVETTPIVTAAQIDDRSSGWIHTESSAAIYIAFAVDTTGSLTGDLTVAHTSDTGTDVTSGSYPLTGTIDASTIAIAFNSKAWTGTIDDNAILLNVPQNDGTIAQGVWLRGSIDDFNAAVAQLQSGALEETAISLAAAEDAATASSLQALAEAEADRVNRVYQRAVNDITALDKAVAELPAALADVDSAVANVKAATLDPALIGTCDYGEAGYALDNVGYAVDNVGYAIDPVGYVTETIPMNIADLQAQIDDLNINAQTDDQVDAIYAGGEAIKDAYAALSSANKSTAKSRATANDLYAKATAAEHAHCPNGATEPTVPTNRDPVYDTIPSDSYPGE